ncbi:DUF4215 domain-containing protein [Myxococcus landrumensis]|uniref:DUF4215 domain-containing protein n=1 Tax=Myxococcus landrumensis TaxID=2813577 RepID=A0ABX7MZK7_9BACT|nr:DUF4215 domain-containing protein [Myxococcus landrumus]QSQ11855.1 DUF4215 domain-containing protein [Myxococcus landrumus]
MKRLGWGVLACMALGACGGGLTPEEESQWGGVSEASSEAPVTSMDGLANHADAVDPETSWWVLNPKRALGAPDGKGATMMEAFGAALVLDMGEGEEGWAPLSVYYQGLTLPVQSHVDFLGADGDVVAWGPLNLVELGPGTHVTLVPFDRPLMTYRYVRLWGASLAMYEVDAVTTLPSLPSLCGDGRIAGNETCDDGNILPGDGCSLLCQLEPGFRCTGEPSVCRDIDECADGTDTCAPAEVCVNLPGSYLCMPACLPPRLMCGGACVDVLSNNSHCGACGNACGAGKTCTVGVCTTPVCLPPRMTCAGECVDVLSNNAHCGTCGNACGTGTTCTAGVCGGAKKLQVTMTWSRNGNGDLLVLTPSGKLISFANRWPGPLTDYGQLDVDDQLGKGPENIFWAESTTPPTGDYRVCAAVTGFIPYVTPQDPVSVGVRIRRNGLPDVELSKTFTAPQFLQPCTPESPTNVGPFNLP